MKYESGVLVPIVTDTEILGFFGKYRFLSNFHNCKVVVDGIEYPSSEHAYMAQKTVVPDERANFTTKAGLSSKNAKKQGQLVTLREDWDDVKVVEMKTVLKAKFTQNDELGRQLLETESKRLEETNYWNDTFWGVCKGVGENVLGKILMDIREELKSRS